MSETLFITSSRVNDDLILHFLEDLGDIFIKCEDNKGELIVPQTLHRVKLIQKLK